MILNFLPKIDNNEFYIFGSGNIAQLLSEGIKREKNIIIKGYIDNDPKKWGKKFNGKQIISPIDYEKDNNIPVMISVTNKKAFSSISDQIKELGGKSYGLDEVIFSIHKKELEKVYELLYDDYSRNIFIKVIKNRVTRELMDEEIIDRNQYFSVREFLIPNANDVMIDCGAYVGDSIEQYIWQMGGVFRKIIAFEPDKANYKAMLIRNERLKREWNLSDDKIECYQYGIGDTDTIANVERNSNNNGLGSKLIDIESTDSFDSEDVNIISLDNFFENRNDNVTFIKADIESYEYKMLCGAKKLITKYSPRIAVCIYHNPIDMYSIPLLVNSINPEYKLKIRHHSCNISETILYAYTD